MKKTKQKMSIQLNGKICFLDQYFVIISTPPPYIENDNLLPITIEYSYCRSDHSNRVYYVYVLCYRTHTITTIFFLKIDSIQVCGKKKKSSNRCIQMNQHFFSSSSTHQHTLSYT